MISQRSGFPCALIPAPPAGCPARFSRSASPVQRRVPALLSPALFRGGGSRWTRPDCFRPKECCAPGISWHYAPRPFVLFPSSSSGIHSELPAILPVFQAFSCLILLVFCKHPFDRCHLERRQVVSVVLHAVPHFLRALRRFLEQPVDSSLFQRI